MAKEKSPISVFVSLAVWLTGILVSLAVGFGMAQRTLTIPWLDTIGASVVTTVAGWIVIVLTLVSVILAIMEQVQ